MKKKIRFHNGPIPGALIEKHISEVSQCTDVGGIDIFLGNIRADVIDGKTVSAITFSAQEALVTEQLDNICKQIADNYPVIEAHVIHSLGTVKAGEVCMAVITGCKHRKDAYQSNIELVERLKKEAPIWGKELFDDSSHQWKENTP